MNVDDIVKILLPDYIGCDNSLPISILCYGGLSQTLITRVFMMGIAGDMILRGEY